MNKQVINAVTHDVIRILVRFNSDHILITGNDDDIVLPVALSVSMLIGLPITPRRDEDQLAVAPGYFSYPGLTLIPKMDDISDNAVLDLITSISTERLQQPTFEKSRKTNLLVIAIDGYSKRVTGAFMPDFPNTKLGVKS